MRRVILILNILLLSKIFAYDFLAIDKIVLEDKAWAYLIYNGNLYWLDAEEESITQINDISLMDNGYTSIKKFDKEFLFIPGESHFEQISLNYVNSDNYLKRKKENYPQYEPYGRSDIHIKKLSASSYYSETINNVKYEYKVENLLNRFVPDCVCHPLNYNDFSLPWVAGDGNNGIGEVINITFTKKSDELSILNGFINWTNLNLYKENSRIKTLKITSDEADFVLEYDFVDIVYFAHIKLPQEVNSIKCEIIDVYQGSKYSDTCVSAILARNVSVNHNINEGIDMYGVDLPE